MTTQDTSSSPIEFPPLKPESENQSSGAKTPFPELFSTDEEGDFIAERSQPEQISSPHLQTDKGSYVQAAIEQMPHLLDRIIQKWGTREFNTFVHQLFLDTRDGSRQGFSFDAVRELNFLTTLNVLIRAQAAAPLLNISFREACELISRGDQAAMGHSSVTNDIWQSHAAPREKTRSFHASPLAKTFQTHHHASQAQVKFTHPAQPKAHSKFASILNQAPPVPPCVRIDLTSPRTLRPNSGTGETESVMEWGFFRCLAKELGGLKLKRLMLSNLGEASLCTWLSASIQFSTKNCSISEVVLHADLLTSTEKQLTDAMASGLNTLAINLNVASGKWRTIAEEVTKNNPDYFKQKLQQLIQARDEIERSAGHRCAISVIQNGRSTTHLLHLALPQLARLPGLTAFRWETDDISEQLLADRLHHGDCHCWAPFIEAHVRTNGHLVACAHDFLGYSFAADLKQVTFTDAWLSHEFRKTRHKVLLGGKPGSHCEICHHRAAKK